MKPKINKDLLPLKIHYFFKYGGIAFFMLLPVLARQKGVPAVAVGFIWMVTPMSSCAINFINSTLADKYKIYRSMFIGGVIALTVSYLSVFLVPNITNNSTLINHENNTLVPQCVNLNTSLALCSEIPQNLIESWKCSEDVHKEDKDLLLCNLHCHMQQNNNENEFNQTFVFKDMNLNFNTSVSDHYYMCEEGSCTIITTSPLLCGNEHTRKHGTCSYYCDTESATLISLTESPEFWLMFVLLIIIYGSNSTTTTMADTICFQILGKDGRHLYGRQRLFGSIGWGIVGLAGGALVDVFSHGDQVNYIPAVIIATIFLTCNILVSIRIPFKIHDREKLKASRVGRALSTFPFLIYLVTVIVGGINMGIVWTFMFIMIEDIAGPSFAHIKLLQGLLIGVGCFLGEVPSLFLSAVVIKKLGSVKTFVISLSVMGLRVFLYSVVKNPWLFLPIELLHGVSFGLFYPNMIASASHLSPPGAMATVQGIVKNSFILGVSLGSLIGGLLVSAVGGPNTFFYLGISDVIFTVVYALVQYLLHLRNISDRKVEYHMPTTTDMETDVVMEEQRSVCDLQMCTPLSDIPELEFPEPLEHDASRKTAL